jgi:hypothetical protein
VEIQYNKSLPIIPESIVKVTSIIIHKILLVAPTLSQQVVNDEYARFELN